MIYCLDQFNNFPDDQPGFTMSRLVLHQYFTYFSMVLRHPTERNHQFSGMPVEEQNQLDVAGYYSHLFPSVQHDYSPDWPMLTLASHHHEPLLLTIILNQYQPFFAMLKHIANHYQPLFPIGKYYQPWSTASHHPQPFLMVRYAMICTYIQPNIHHCWPLSEIRWIACQTKCWTCWPVEPGQAATTGTFHEGRGTSAACGDLPMNSCCKQINLGIPWVIATIG